MVSGLTLSPCQPLFYDTLDMQLDECSFRLLQDGGYHVPFAHKGLAAGLDMQSYQSALYERISIQSVQSAADADARLSGAFLL